MGEAHIEPGFRHDETFDDANTLEVADNRPARARNAVVVIYDPALHQEHLTFLLSKEIDFGTDYDDQERATLLMQVDELNEAVAWILRNRGVHGFQPRTAFVAIIYFERLIFKINFMGIEYRPHLLRTAWVACLSLAAKMEERTKTRLLSEYEVKRFKIEARRVQRMELDVCSRLEWRMRQVTPFDFIEYFIATMEYGKNELQEMKHDTIEKFLLYLPREIVLVHNKPSVMAAAATIMAYEANLTRAEVEAKINSFPNLKFLEAGKVCRIYEILRGKFTRPMKTGSDSD